MGLDGIYITNYYDDKSYYPSDSKIKTAITYDKGGEWSKLPRPTNDQTCTDPKTCFLNLFGPIDSFYSRFYSDPSAVGLVLSTGNVGSSLRDMNDDVNTYFSRDAGWTWTQLSGDSCTYEFGDHGAIMVLVPNEKWTNTFLYTWNQGLSLTMCQFTDDPIEVTNIMVEPSATSQNFLLYGTFRNNSAGLFFLNFAATQVRACRGSNVPDTPDSDYETWSPSDALGTDCLMGQKMVYLRRKQSSVCFNGLDYEPSHNTTFCPCTDEDYEWYYFHTHNTTQHNTLSSPSSPLSSPSSLY
jgi:hypothetical protein